ncbi:hypothetical protein ACFQY4_24820 [Catellatospora bangladeshensis]|uniref:hypothetical protein n=1 Tax=Catellatospora bangladeshensis TaxID=310355 RepID=UPI00361A0816
MDARGGHLTVLVGAAQGEHAAGDEPPGQRVAARGVQRQLVAHLLPGQRPVQRAQQGCHRPVGVGQRHRLVALAGEQHVGRAGGGDGEPVAAAQRDHRRRISRAWR